VFCAQALFKFNLNTKAKSLPAMPEDELDFVNNCIATCSIFALYFLIRLKLPA